MGSRAVVVVCRDGRVAERTVRRRRATGAVYTRTGRPFFSADGMESALLARLRAAIDATRPVGRARRPTGSLLDAEMHAVVAEGRGAAPHPVRRGRRGGERGARRERWPPRAARSSAGSTSATSSCARGRSAPDVDGVHRRLPPVLLAGRRPRRRARRAVPGARRRGRPCCSSANIRGTSAIADRLADAAPGLVQRTRNLVVDVTDPEQTAAAVAWWEELTAAGGEGMVVKPVDPVRARDARSRATRHQGPRPRVPADHLRARLHRRPSTCSGCASAASATSARSRSRVRSRGRGAGAGRARGAAAPRARVRVRRARPRERAGRPPAVGSHRGLLDHRDRRPNALDAAAEPRAPRSEPAARAAAVRAARRRRTARRPPGAGPPRSVRGAVVTPGRLRGGDPFDGDRGAPRSSHAAVPSDVASRHPKGCAASFARSCTRCCTAGSTAAARSAGTSTG